MFFFIIITFYHKQLSQMHQIKLMQKKLFDLDWRGNWHSFLLRGYIENKKD